MQAKKSFQTGSGIKVEEIYTPKEIANLDYSRDLGFPGQFPFTRGIWKDMYRGKLWTMRQYAGYGTSKESNQRYKYLLSQGQTGLSVAFDLPTQMGYDSDHPLAMGEVGRTGVAISTLEDMEILFDGIPQEQVSVSMTINATASILLAMYIAVAIKNKVALEKLSGTIQNDILKEYIARKTYIFPPQGSLRLITDIFQYCSQHLPRWNPISISGYHMREAGATAVQELAFTFANAICYVEAALKAGLKIDDFAPRLSFFFISSSDFFEEIAKFRVARKIWAKLMKEKFKAKKEDSWKLRFHTQTSGSSLTAQQVDNNIIRVTLQALSAVLGGTQSLHTNAKDESLALPTEQSAQLALRTQQIIAYESGVTNTVDPLGGSYFLESLTNEIEEEVLKYLEKIEEYGGALAAIESGFYQQEIAKSAYEFQKKVEAGEQIIVGVNKFQTDEEVTENILKVDQKGIEEQIKRLNSVRKKRDNAKVKKSLQVLKEKSKSRENLMLPILECVQSYCSIGEICDSLREVWGEYKEKF